MESTLSFCERANISSGICQGVVNSKGDGSVGAVEMGSYYYIDSKRIRDSGDTMVTHHVNGYGAPAVTAQVLSTIGLFSCLVCTTSRKLLVWYLSLYLSF